MQVSASHTNVTMEADVMTWSMISSASAGNTGEKRPVLYKYTLAAIDAIRYRRVETVYL